ncbi:NADP-specific glutamate dehydrogenase [Marinobacter confluentis]|uniref:Glutamate dehydrogenase n=1 Tax=Marinobacter confluentis TaxID=1697557 RepID=A0A4Z1BX71_9GAMM|nr:NADP-specific glutamate dehydrogenase [Marinobacter confluentis]TGN39210.1 NADP-specific glutamate dehydrogenase [Marinobacter confluentis]
MASIASHIQSILQKTHPRDTEFHQAVTEIIDDIADLYEENPDYARWNVLERLIEPDRVLRFRVCWEDDDGHVQVNRGWRVQHNHMLGAYKGGLRFDPSVSESVLKFLAFEQCFKNALTGLPMGGGKGGSDFNPKGRSEREVMRFCQAFMQELYRHIGPDMDVPAGDINVGPREIGFLYGHYVKLTNRWEGVLTGKSPNFGGSCGRVEATGYGVVYFLENMLNAHDRELEGTSVMITGSGNVALHAAEKAIQEGAKVLTLSDSGGTIEFKDGMTGDDMDYLKRLKQEEGKPLAESSSGKFHQGQKPWQVTKAAVLLPCAIQNEVDGDAVDTMLKNELVAVCEGANMPLTAEAQEKLIASNSLYGPGKAANAGGVAVSSLERSQNAIMQSWTSEEVDRQLKDIMAAIHDRCIEHVSKNKAGVYPYSRGANLYGFRRLADAMVAFGLH